MELYEKAFSDSDKSILTRLKLILYIGTLSAFWYLAVVITCSLIMMFFIVVQPKQGIQKEKTFNYKYYIQLLEKKYKIKKTY